MKRQGFTIVECIVALLITAMIAVLIQLTFKVYEKVDQQPYDDNAQWYIFLQEMESSNNQYEIKIFLCIFTTFRFQRSAFGGFQSKKAGIRLRPFGFVAQKQIL